MFVILKNLGNKILYSAQMQTPQNFYSVVNWTVNSFIHKVKVFFVYCSIKTLATMVYCK